MFRYYFFYFVFRNICIFGLDYFTRSNTIYWISTWRKFIDFISLRFLTKLLSAVWLCWQNTRIIEQEIRFIVNKSLQKHTLVTGLSFYLFYYIVEKRRWTVDDLYSLFGSWIHSLSFGEKTVRCSLTIGKWIFVMKLDQISLLHQFSVNQLLQCTMYISWNIKWILIKMIVI